MCKVIPQPINGSNLPGFTNSAQLREVKRSPLAKLVHAHLQARHLRQIDFCRQTGFDQGLLSKILSSVVTTLNVETTLKLAEGLNIAPLEIFEATGKKEVDDLLRRFYGNK
jgi:transcriptional regulator with XRE-family HTH domain